MLTEPPIITGDAAFKHSLVFSLLQRRPVSASTQRSSRLTRDHCPVYAIPRSSVHKFQRKASCESAVSTSLFFCLNEGVANNAEGFYYAALSEAWRGEVEELTMSFDGSNPTHGPRCRALLRLLRQLRVRRLHIWGGDGAEAVIQWYFHTLWSSACCKGLTFTHCRLRGPPRWTEGSLHHSKEASTLLTELRFSSCDVLGADLARTIEASAGLRQVAIDFPEEKGGLRWDLIGSAVGSSATIQRLILQGCGATQDQLNLLVERIQSAAATTGRKAGCITICVTCDDNLADAEINVTV